MKKTQYSLIAILAVASMAASCTQEPLNTPDPVSPLGDLTVFTAVAAQPGDGTKAALAEEGAVKWSPNDRITIYSGDGTGFTGVYLYTGTEAVASAEFTYALGTITTPDLEKGFWAVYPSESAEGVSADGTSVTVGIPETQYAIAGTFDPWAFVSVAKSQDLSLSFKNVCGGVKFRVTRDDIDYVEFTANSGEALAGLATVQMDANGLPTVTGVTNPQSTIRLYAPGGGTFATDTDYYLVCLPAILATGFDMTYHTASSTEGMLAQGNFNVVRSQWGRLATAYNVPIPDAAAKAICVANWDTDGDGELSFAEAAAVTSIVYAFRGNHDITNLDFLVYFTGLSGHWLNDYAFEDCDHLESITLPDGIIGIGQYAFYNCAALTNITIPSSVTQIMTGAFQCCSSISGIVLPGNIETIGDYAFRYCSGITGSVTIPASAITIGDSVFYECTSLSGAVIQSSTVGTSMFDRCNNLSSVTLATGVKSIGDMAFSHCKMTSVSIPNTVTSIGSEAFFDCQELESVTLQEGLESIDFEAFRNCTALTDITIPSTVTAISNGLFYDCDHLTSVTMQGNVTSIGDDAFRSCSALGSITIPTTVETIGVRAFLACTGLESITIPSGVTVISNELFSDCENLSSVTMQGNVTSIGDKAFYNCSALVSFTIPASVKTIGQYAFAECHHLDGVLSIPEGVTSIGYRAFLWCIDLDGVTIPASVTTIGGEAFYRCTGIVTATIAEGGEKTIGACAFMDCTSLESITIPSGVTSIAQQTFYGCTSLTNVTIPEGVTSIGVTSFHGCSSLTSITLPSTVTLIQSRAFLDCRLLSVIKILATTPPTLEATGGWGAWFSGILYFGIYVPDAYVATYQADEQWSKNYNSHIHPISEIPTS